MFELHGLNGASIFVNPMSIYRIRRTTEGEAPAACEVQYAGSYLLSEEAANDILARMAGTPQMVALTARDQSTVWLNKALISAVRPAARINGPGTEITVAGHYQHVLEPVAEVVELIA